MRRALTVAGKDLMLLWRDKGAVFWVLVFPLLIGILFGVVFGGEGSGVSPSKIAVVDQDGSLESRALLGRLKASSALSVSEPSIETAREGVRKGDLSAYLVIPEGYGQAARQFRYGDVPLRMATDPARKAEVGMIQGVVAQAAYGGFAEMLSDPRKMQDTAKQALTDIEGAAMPEERKVALTGLLKSLEQLGSTSEPSGAAMSGPKLMTVPMSANAVKPASSFEVSFPQALVWGILGVVSTFAVSMVKERAQGTLLRLRSSPMSMAEILGGKAIACFVTVVLVMALLLTFAALVFGVRVASLPNLAIAIVASGVCFVGIMMLLSVLGRTEQSVAGSSWGVLIILAMFGGGMLPVFVMPPWMQQASSASPLKWSVVSIEGAIWRNYSVEEMLLPAAILLTTGVISFLIGVRVLSARAEI